MSPPRPFIVAAVIALFLAKDVWAASDEFIILAAVTECVKEYNLDRVSSTPTAGQANGFADEQGRLDFYVKRAVVENLALKHCENARAILHPMLKTADSELNRSIGLLDSSFAIRENIHRHALEMIDSVSSGRGHANVSEIGKAGADAIEALNLFTNGTVAIFSKLLPSLSTNERQLLAQKISGLFPKDQKVHDKKSAEAGLPDEVALIMAVRDQLLNK